MPPRPAVEGVHSYRTRTAHVELCVRGEQCVHARRSPHVSLPELAGTRGCWRPPGHPERESQEGFRKAPLRDLAIARAALIPQPWPRRRPPLKHLAMSAAKDRHTLGRLFHVQHVRCAFIQRVIGVQFPTRRNGIATSVGTRPTFPTNLPSQPAWFVPNRVKALTCTSALLSVTGSTCFVR